MNRVDRFYIDKLGYTKDQVQEMKHADYNGYIRTFNCIVGVSRICKSQCRFGPGAGDAFNI